MLVSLFRYYIVYVIVFVVTVRKVCSQFCKYKTLKNELEKFENLKNLSVLLSQLLPADIVTFSF